jgi:peptide/nickel transport system permease protein
MSVGLELESPERLAADAAPERTPQRAWRRLLGTWEGRAGVALLGAIALIVALGPLVAPYDPQATNLAPAFDGPSGAHPLGTDDLGRDVMSRLLWGGGALVGAPMAGMGLALVLGSVAGMVAGLRGGIVDHAIARATDSLLVIPGLLVLIVLVTSLGRSSATIVLGVVMVFTPVIVRLVRGTTQAVAAEPYVEVARARGESTLGIVVREILPNVVGIIAVQAAVALVAAVLFVATLSFLGLGAQPPSSNWGLMAAEGRDLLRIAPLVSLSPVALLIVLSVALSLLADAAHKVVSRDHGHPSGVFS